MLSVTARFLLVSTALSPVLAAVAIQSIADNQSWRTWIWWVIVALCLVILCWLLLRYAASNVQKDSVTIESVERHDREMLAFLFVYLLPFVRSDDGPYEGTWITLLFVFCIIVLAIVHAGALHFNPVMSLLRYRFYSIRDDQGVSSLLIMKERLARPGNPVQVVQLARDVYLRTDSSSDV